MNQFESIEALNHYLLDLSHQTRQAIDSAQFPLAEQLILKVLEAVPNHTVALSDLAFVKGKMGKLQEAYQLLRQIIESTDPNNPEIGDSYNFILSLCIDLKRNEEASYYGQLSVNLRRNSVIGAQTYPIPHMKPKGVSADKTKNIISFSLFGANPRYCEVSVINAQLAKEIYPEWTCRFYVDESVPTVIVERLRAEGAEVIFIQPHQKAISGLFWRFFVMDDPNVQCFICRDADSIISYKEKAAVDEWLVSGKWFHIMRDNLNHSELILAGMWGGYTGVFPNMEDIIAHYLPSILVKNNNIDQVFLRRILYPTVAQSVLVHDSFHYDKAALNYPDYPISDIERTPHFHIGMVYAGIQPIQISVDFESVKRVRWFVLDEQGKEICHYENDVPESKSFQVFMPYSYSEKILAGQWKVVSKPII